MVKCIRFNMHSDFEFFEFFEVIKIDVIFKNDIL